MAADKHQKYHGLPWLELSPALRDALENLARERGVSIDEVTEEALARYLKAELPYLRTAPGKIDK
jgi:hypothetical protein